MIAGVVVAVLLLSSGALAQVSAAVPPAPPPLKGSIASRPDWPKAKPGDVDSIDHILAALYGAISGPAGQPRDTSRLRSICVPDARLIPTRHAADGTDAAMLTVDEYIARSAARMEATGFYERSTHNTVEQFGSIAHVFSTYESRHALTDAKPFARGINSIQLLNDGGRYWVVNIFWDAERAETPIPAKYLP